MLDDRGRLESYQQNGPYYPAGGGYNTPSVGTATTVAQVIPPSRSTPVEQDMLTRLLRRFFPTLAWNKQSGVMDGRTTLVDASASRAVSRWANPDAPAVDDRAQRASDGQDPTIANVSAWQDRTAHAFDSTIGSDQELHQGEAPYRIQRPWVPGLTAWAGLNEYGFTQSAFRLRMRPMMKSSGYVQTMAARRRNTSHMASTNTNASRRRIPAVRVPTAPLSGR